MTDLSVRLGRDDGRAVLTVAGELDLATVPRLREPAQEQLTAEGGTGLTLDLAGLTFLDSSGLGLLVELRNLANGNEVPIELVNVPAATARVMAIAGLAETFGLPADADEDDSQHA